MNNQTENNNNQPTPAEAERLLKAIFAEGEKPDDDYPNTTREKVGYSQYVVTHILQDLGKSIHRINRLYALISVAEKDGKNELPDIITNNELRMAIEPLLHVQKDIDEVASILSELYADTEAGKS